MERKEEKYFCFKLGKKKQKKRGGKDDKRNNAQVQNLTLKIDFGIFILANGAHSAERNYQKNKTENTWNAIMSCTDYFSLCPRSLPLDSLISLPISSDFCGNRVEKREQTRGKGHDDEFIVAEDEKKKHMRQSLSSQGMKLTSESDR